MTYKQIIVVEGYHDQQKLKSIYPEIECVITNGSEISEETLNLIYQLSLKHEVVLFLDPDYPGKRITQKIIDKGGKYKLAYINKDKAISKNNKKVGIEHAKESDIIDALDNLLTVDYSRNLITRKMLSDRKLINSKNSSIIRMEVCKSLNIPYGNGKTFLRHLNLLQIDIERIDEILYGQ